MAQMPPRARGVACGAALCGCILASTLGTLGATGAVGDPSCVANEAGGECPGVNKGSSLVQMRAKTQKSSTQQYPHDLMTCNTSTAPLKTASMTEAQYDAIVASITGLINQLSATCTATNCDRADFMGCVLRMAGHDFMDYDPTTQTGGSDGCTSMVHADNAGLAACLYAGESGVSMAQAYQDHCGDVSLADFLVVAAEAVMSQSRVLANLSPVDFKSSFSYGRETATACPDAASRLPDPLRGCTAVSETFLTAMGLDWAGAAALMGVHTMGRARTENSGFHGWWSDPVNSGIFNNDYYISLMAKGWRPETAVGGTTVKSQWGRSDNGQDQSFAGHEMMLDTDMCLAYAHQGQPVDSQVHDCCAWVTFAVGGVRCGNKMQCCGPPGPVADCGNGGR